MQIRKILILLFLALSFLSCMNDDDFYSHQDYNEQTSGVFIVNEGNFMYENASLSYYIPDSMEVENDVFTNANETILGDVAQSMTIRDSLGYIVLNNSGKVYVININTFEYSGKIIGLTSPRYMHFVSDTKAYISDLYGKAIAIVNPKTFEVIGSINVNNPTSNFYQHPTEQMIQYNEFVFVNCWSYDNKILVIDSNTDQLVDSIEVPIQPRAMVMDRYDQLWVITDGGFQGNPYGYEEPALVRIDAATRQIQSALLLDIESSPADMAINKTGDTLYFINGDVYRYPVNESVSPEIFIESPYSGSFTQGFSAIGIHPNTNEVYLADVVNNVDNGFVYRYLPNTTPIDTFRVGIIPTYFCFK